MMLVLHTAEVVVTFVLLPLYVFCFYRMLVACDDNEFLRWRAKIWQLGIATVVVFSTFVLSALFNLLA